LSMWSRSLFALLLLFSFLVGLICPFTIVGIQFEFWSLVRSLYTSWWLVGSCWVVFLGCRIIDGCLILLCFFFFM
jgi:hypothetical protein